MIMSQKVSSKKDVRPADRAVSLLHRRHLKMAASAHAYVRGNTVRFYEWLEATCSAGVIPDGPAIWICGDCHVGNLGPVANTEGEVEVQIRDLDQTVIGNPAHDLVRLSLSLAMAARGSDLPGVTTALMMEQVVAGYRLGLLNRHDHGGDRRVEPIRVVMKQALRRKWRHLAEERIEGVTPQIPLGRRFWRLKSAERKELEELIGENETRTLITCLRSRSDDAAIHMLDAAYWVKGCSSLGRTRYAVLVGIGQDASEGMCLLDIKESIKPAAPRIKRESIPLNNADRVVMGAKALSPFLGDRMLARKLDGRAIVMRELMPQDLKLELETLTQAEAVATARVLASVVGRAHGRQMDLATRRKWARELRKGHAKSISAPPWLWKSIVDLAASHEAGYLEHCRAYALSAEKTR
jgi:uncharacterized protein (DUF2252 family)